MNGIDLSVHNGKVDFRRIKDAGIEFVVIRAGYGRVLSQKDKMFEDNYAGATAAGLHVGAYWYSYAKTPDEARLEADVFLEVVKGKQFDFPVYFDIEEQSVFATGKANCSAICKAFLEKVEAAGYWVGIYSSRCALQDYISEDLRKRYAIWLADWGNAPKYNGEFGIWQRSEKGNVDGVSGNVDLDVAYVDYAPKIKERGLNGYSKGTTDKDTQANKKETMTIRVTLENGDVYEGKVTKV